MLTRRREQKPEQVEENSAKIAAALVGTKEWKSASTILLYSATPYEVQTQQLILKALGQRKRVCLPAAGSINEAFPIDGIAGFEQFRQKNGFFAHPDGVNQLVPLDEVDLAVVPGVAFDAKGNRLGRGGGFYDRLLAGFSAPKAGLAFQLQVVSKVPVEKDHDVPMDLVVTEKQIIRPGK